MTHSAIAMCSRGERRAAPKGHEVAHCVAHATRIPSGDRPTYSSDEGLS
jgi:hypothetical protein